MATRIQLRRDTAANWVSANPILRPGEIGIETDTLKFKIGNGSTWTATTSYANVTPSGLTNSLGDYILVADQGNPGGPAELDSNGDLIIPENSIILWNDEAHTYHTTITATQPTANRTITLPDSSGTIALTSDISTAVSNLVDGAPGLLDTLNELAAAVNDDPAFFTTVATNLSNHESDTTNIHGIADTSKLVVTDATQTLTNKTLTSPKINEDVSVTATATEINVLDGITASTTELNYVDGVTSAIQTQLDSKASSTDLTNHASDTTGIHGISDTSELATKTFAAELLTNATKSNITITGDKNGLTITAENGVADSTTDNLVEGSTNKYFTDERAQDAVAQALANGTHTNITVGYDDATNAISLTGAVTYTDENAQDAVGNAVGNGLDYDDNTGAISVDPSEFALNAVGAPTGDVSMATYKITNLGAPTASTDAATKAYVDSATEGLHIHESVVAATTTNVDLATALENGDTLDGVTLATGNRILVKNQTTTSENGIYVVQASGQPVRATDFDTATEVDSGDFVFVYSGTVNASTGWVQTNRPATIGTDPIAFTQFSGAGTYLAGNGLNLTGNTFSINTGTTVDLNTSQILTNKTLTSPIINGATIGGSLIPSTNATYDLGSSANKFRDLYLSGTTLYLDAASIQLNSGNIQFNHSGNTTTLPIGGGSHTLTTRAGAETLTNKTLTSPTINSPTISNPAFTGTATGITKAMVGLGNVDNTSDANKPISTATQTALNLKAPVDSPIFTGTVSLPNGTITNEMIETGSIANNKLANSSITMSVDGVNTTVSLGGSFQILAADPDTQGIVYGRVDSVNNNTGIGYYALRNLTTGTNNSALGQDALNALQDGINNVAIGSSAGSLLLSGSQNVIVGTSAANTLDFGSNNIVIGFNAATTSTNTNNQIVLGNSLITSFRIPGLGINATTSNNLVTETNTQTLTNKTLTNVNINGVNFGAGPVPVPTPTEDEHAVSKAYLENQLAQAVGSDIYPLDDISVFFDGSESRFQLTYDGDIFIPQNPYKLLITINGILQILGNQDRHWLSLIPSDGYYFDEDGFAQFGEPVPVGSKFEGRYMSGPESQNAKKSIYPFRAVDIQLGD